MTPTERHAEYEARWNHGGLCFLGAFADLLTNEEANETAAEFVRAKIRSRVHDPSIADALSPRGYPLGTKRLCVESNYYETFNRDNVTLVSLRNTPIITFTAHGLRARDAEYASDSVVFATGFDAITGALLRINIRGRDGCTLRQRWAVLPRSNLGIQVAGFPNLFTITGPASPSVLSNMIVSIEQHVDWIADCLSFLRSHRYAAIETTAEAEDDWMAHVDRGCWGLQQDLHRYSGKRLQRLHLENLRSYGSITPTQLLMILRSFSMLAIPHPETRPGSLVTDEMKDCVIVL